MFADYKSKLLPNLNDKYIVVFTASNLTMLSSVNICNRSDFDISINLAIYRPDISPINLGEGTTAFIVNKRLVTSLSSLNILDSGNDEIYMQKDDGLFIYSYDYRQIFDCVLCYSEIVIPKEE